MRGRREEVDLAAETSSFVGRERELALVVRLLSTGRLVTLTGAGGVGKTRLAHRAARRVRREFPGGSCRVSLAELPRTGGAPGEPAGGQREPAEGERGATDVRADDRQAVAHLVAAALGLSWLTGGPLDAVRGYLAPRRALLVLDDCERLLDGCATLVEALLRACPRVRILATSQEPLAILGEAVLPVRPLPVPPVRARDGRPGGTPDPELLRCPSVALFVARAETAVPEFRLTAGNQDAVAAICRRLEGLPLAIELAAARLRALSPQQILDRLPDPFSLLAGGRRGRPHRQQTMRACVDWSYGLCTPAEQRLWSRLAVFADGFELDAVEDVCAGDGLAAVDLLDLTAALVDKSILVRDEREGPAARYRMLETLRIYGRDRLREAGGLASVRRRHRDWMARLADQAAAEWISDRQAYWLDRLGRERPELRAAVEFCLTEPGEAPSALHLAGSLPLMYWWEPGLIQEGRRWLDLALEQVAAPTVTRARALLLSSRLALFQGDAGASVRLRAEGEELAGRLGAPVESAYAVFLRGAAALMRNELPAAAGDLEEAAAVLALAPDPQRHLDLRLFTLCALVLAAGLAGEQPRAAAAFEEILAVTAPRAEIQHRSGALWARGLAAWRQGDLDAAAGFQVDSLLLRQSGGLDDRVGSGLCLEALAWIAWCRNDARRAALLLGAAGATLTETGGTIRGLRHLVGFHERCEQGASAALGDQEFGRAVHAGARMSVAEALVLAVDERPQRRPARPATAPLTPREAQVADLVAQGLTNRQIARRLEVSTRTAESHVEHILAKLGYASRSQIATWAVRQRAADQPQQQLH